MSNPETYFSGLFNQMSFAVCMVGKDYIITRANDYFESRVLHDNEPCVVGKNILKIFPDYADFIKRKLDTAFIIESSSFSSWEQNPHVLPFKSSRPVSGLEEKMYQDLEVLPIYTEDETVEQVCLCVYDVTSKASQQLELKRVSAELKKEHEAQSVLIQKLNDAQGQLLQSEKMASIGQLSAGIAHEINNPLGFVTSNIRTLSDYFKSVSQALNDITHMVTKSENITLQEGCKNIFEEHEMDYILDDIKELIEESLEGSDRVMSIVKDLKDFSHVDKAEWSEINLEDSIESTLKIVHNEIKFKVTIEKHYEPNLPLIRCQPMQIKQVLLNLFVNAGQAIKEKGILSISLAALNENNVVIKIKDTGSGISEANINRIFEPFFTTKEIGMGTGLGLSVSYGIIKNHKGTISAASELGKGTEFTITLPI